ncbi:hypothetical protein LTR04_006981 [Oleoguttula sp. CCFEE 6159]|nr:hypothetical protein LTR04_006981 [Oleoguttula sp. CCFEE 6159]
MDGQVVGVLGGGQLGRMLVEAANRLNIQCRILDAKNAPAKQIQAHGQHVEGSFKDANAVRELANSGCTVLTVEIEHVNTDVLKEVSERVNVEPHWETLQLIQDKYLQHQHLYRRGVATAACINVEQNNEDSLRRIGQELEYPFMLKSRKEAYDGRGNYPVKSEADIPGALEALSGRSLYAERWAHFRKELAVNVVKTKDSVISFPTVETVHEDSICKLVYAPARDIAPKILAQAQELAKRAVACFKGKGVFGVEMFLLHDDTLLINEIAPRPHNSGHYTIEACPISQYDAHLRAILDLPIPEESLKLRQPAIMLNILGGSKPDSHLAVAKEALANPRTSIHLYGKGDGRPGRKMGHVTITAPSMREAEQMIQPLIDAVDEVRAGTGKSQKSAQPAAARGQSHAPQPLVAVISGSDSDIPKLNDAYDVLDKFDIPYECGITSAHRTPDYMAQYVGGCAEKGIKVIIAAAGGAAHLPGMASAYTPLPVIGIPIKPSIGDGTDSLLSIVAMPKGAFPSTRISLPSSTPLRPSFTPSFPLVHSADSVYAGVPTACVGINNSTNAALLAARILGASDPAIGRKVEEYMADSNAAVREKDSRLQEEGPREYQAKRMAKK